MKLTLNDLPDLATTVPHKPPMLLLDEIVSFDAERKECIVSASLHKSSLMWDKTTGRARIHWLTELIAQCVAVNYYLQMMTSGGKPCRGFLVAIDSFSAKGCQLEPTLGDVLVTSLMEAEVYPFGVFSGTVSRQEVLWAKATMKFLTDDGRKSY